MPNERDEALEQAIHFIQQSAERWHDRLTYKNLRLAERYLEAKLEVFVPIKVPGIGDEQFGAILQRVDAVRANADRHGWQVLYPIGHTAKQPSGIEGHACVGGSDGEQQAMLVDQIKVVDQPELFSVPTLIRLERTQLLCETLRGTAYLSAYKGLQFCGRRDERLAPDGECCLVGGAETAA